MKELPLRPLFDKLIVKPDATEEVSTGGIHIPGDAQEKTSTGVVVAAGEGKKNLDGLRRPLDMKVGDRVMYAKFVGSTIKLEGGEYLLLTEDEVVGIFVDEKA